MCIRDRPQTLRKYINTYSRSLWTANFTFSCPELDADDESSVRSSAVRGNFTSGRHPLGSSSSVLKVPNATGLHTVWSPWFFVLLLKSLPWSISPKLPRLRISVVGENGRGWSYREVKHDTKLHHLFIEIFPDNSGSPLKDHGPWTFLERAICAGT